MTQKDDDQDARRFWIRRMEEAYDFNLVMDKYPVTESG